MATKPKTTTPIPVSPDAPPLTPAPAPSTARAARLLDPTQIAAEAEATAVATAAQRRAILTQLAQATQIPEGDLLILFGLPT